MEVKIQLGKLLGVKMRRVVKWHFEDALKQHIKEESYYWKPNQLSSGQDWVLQSLIEEQVTYEQMIAFEVINEN